MYQKLHTRLLFLFFIGTVFFVPSIAQQNDTLRFLQMHYTAENGLPQNSVRSMLYTSEGFLWMTTENGLTRFDGNNFKVYNKKNTGVAINRFLDIVYDFNARVYTALSYKGEKLRINGSEPILAGKLGSRDSLYTSFKRDITETWPFTNGARWPDKFLVVSVSATEQYLVQHETVGFYNRDQALWQLPYHSTEFLMLPNMQRRFFSFGKQLFLFNANNRFITFTAGGIKPVAVTGDLLKNIHYGKTSGQPVVYWTTGRDMALVHLDGSWYTVTLTKDHVLHTQLVFTNFNAVEKNVGCALYDAGTRQVFLGTLTDGLFIYKKKLFSTRSTANGGFDNSFYGIIPYANNAVLSARGYLVDSNGTRSVMKPLYQRNDTYSITSDRSGRVYGKQDIHVYCYADPRLPPLKTFVVDAAVTQLFSDTLADRMWVGTRTGLYVIDTKKTGLINKRYTFNMISFIQRESDSVLWVGTTSGAYRLNILTGEKEEIPELKGNDVRSIVSFVPGEMWITTYEDGFYMYKYGRTVKFPLDKNRYLATAHTMVLDKKDFLWISTNNGLFRASRKELLEYAVKQTSSPYYFYYGVKDGLPTNEFNGGGENCAVTLANGNFAFSSLKGIVVFDPDDAPAPDLSHNIYISSVMIDNKPVALSDSLFLPNDNNHLRIDVSVPFSGSAENITLEYALQKNFKDITWLPLENNSIAFTTIPSGSYRLLIRYKKGFQYNTYVTKTMAIQVAPAVYETLFFKTAVTLLLIMAVYLFMLLRYRHLQKRNTKLDRIVTERTNELRVSLEALRLSEEGLRKGMRLQERLIASITHDIKTPLRFLSMATRKTLEKKRGSEDITVEETKVIYQTSQQLYHLTEKMLQLIRTNIHSGDWKETRFNVHELVQQKIRLFEDIAQSKNNQLLNAIDPGIAFYGKEDLLGVIIHNLIDNAIKFTSDGFIRIDSIPAPSGLKLVISDNGSGMTEEALRKHRDYFLYNTGGGLPDYSEEELQGGGLGFEIIREILPLVSASISFSTSQQLGTQVMLVINNTPVSR